MSRKSVLKPYKLLNAVNIATSQTSAPTNVEGIDNFCIELEWTGTSPVGVVTVETASQDSGGNYSTWKAIDFGATISITGASGNHLLFIKADSQFYRVVLKKKKGK
jgi:hypothetical protein